MRALVSVGRSERGSMTAELAVAFPLALVAVVGLGLAIRDQGARTQVQELAFQAADAVVAANSARAGESAAEQILRGDSEGTAACAYAQVKVRDASTFVPGGTVDVDVQCDVRLAPRLVVAYTATAKRRIDPHRQVGKP